MYPIGTILDCIDFPGNLCKIIINDNDKNGSPSAQEYSIIAEVIDKNKANGAIFHSGPSDYAVRMLQRGNWYRYIKGDLSSDNLNFKIVEMKPVSLAEFLSEED